MSSVSDWLEEAIANHFFRNGNIPSPAQLFLHLYKTDPTDADVGSEINGAGYDPPQITFTAPVQVGGRAVIYNDIDIIFDAATSDWGTVAYFGVRTAKNGGNLLGSTAVPVPKTILAGDFARFPANTIAIKI